MEICVSNEEKFSGKAMHFDNGRPTYAESLIDKLYSEYGFSAQSVIADIGSGTGIFTEQLLKRGSIVYSVEPNTDMRIKCEKKLKGYRNFISVRGNASNTHLLDSSVNIITVAQALHWFPLTEFCKECNRILKPPKLVVIVYNQRCNNAINEKLTSTIARYCDFNSNSTGPAFIETNRKRIRDFFHGKFIEFHQSNPLEMDYNKFLNYWLSRSYAPREGYKTYESFINDMITVFNHYAKDGVLTLEHESVAYIGNVQL